MYTWRDRIYLPRHITLLTYLKGKAIIYGDISNVGSFSWAALKKNEVTLIIKKRLLFLHRLTICVWSHQYYTYTGCRGSQFSFHSFDFWFDLIKCLAAIDVFPGSSLNPENTVVKFTPSNSILLITLPVSSWLTPDKPYVFVLYFSTTWV